MKRAFGLLTSLVLLASCGEGTTDGYRISGTLSGEIEDGKRVFLRRSDENLQTVDVDTTAVQGGTFSFEGAIEQPELYYVFVEGSRSPVPLVLEKGSVELRGHVDSLSLARVSGTPQNEAYSEFLSEAREMSLRRMSMNQDLNAAVQQNDSAIITALRDEYFELQDRQLAFEQDFVASHPEALISVLILNRLLEGELTPVQEIKSLYAALDPSIKETHHARTLAEVIARMETTAIGATAPDFSGPSPDGETLSLKGSLGKVTLVDFWAGWCRPCRAENPNIVQVYNQYKDKGFQVLGVSLDRNETQWKEAIAKDGLVWPQISNLQYFNGPIAQLYGIRAIPASFLLDENGVIIAKNLRGPALGAKVAELLP